MTMRVRNEPMHVMPVIEPDKSYAFTWPGQPRRTVPGHELLAILKGANPTMLDIEEQLPSVKEEDGRHE